MFYLVKDTEWSKALNIDLFYEKEDYAGGKSSIMYAGIFTEEDKENLLFKQKIEDGTVEFIPITKDIEMIFTHEIQRQATDKIKEFQKYVASY